MGIPADGAARYRARLAGERRRYSDLYAGTDALVEPADPALARLLDRFHDLVRARTGLDVWGHVVAEADRRPGARLLSLGSGACGLEIDLLGRFRSPGRVVCTDVNLDLLRRGAAAARPADPPVSFACLDLNELRLRPGSIDLALAHASLHHLVALERVLDEVRAALRPGGAFLVYDVVARNGMRLWPETAEALRRVWRSLPPRLRRRGGREVCETYPDIDRSEDGFECARSEEILPLLRARFRVRVEVPGFAYVRRLVDTEFGRNWDLGRAEDRGILDRAVAEDLDAVARGSLRPESVFMILE